RLDKLLAQCRAELDAAQEAHNHRKALLARKAVSLEECREAESRQQVCQARLEQVQAEKRARQAKGGLEAEAELGRRRKGLGDAQAGLALLEAGTRREEIEAEAARLARLQEEEHYLEQLEGQVQVRSPVAGLVTTPRLKDRVGQYVHEGELICTVEESSLF